MGFERFVLVAASVSTVLVVFLSVLMRYVFKTDLYGVEEIIIILAMWLYFIGGAYGGYKGSHITADVLSSHISSPRVRRALRIITAAIVFLCCVVLVKWSLTYLAFIMRINAKSISLRLPMLLSQIPICICFFLSLLYSIYHLINAILDRKPIIVDDGGGDAC